MAQHKTPGVYIQEPNSFPSSIVGVPTAVPAFIGYTEKATDGRKDLRFTPTMITSMAEYVAAFGKGCPRRYSLVEFAAPPQPGERAVGTVELGDPANKYRLVGGSDRLFDLYGNLQLFYANGGGPCYVVSCGTYGGGSGKQSVEAADLLRGAAAAADMIGPTILACPEAVLLPEADQHAEIVAAMLGQCMEKRDRFAILDVWGAGDLSPDDDIGPTIARFRQAVAAVPGAALSYGAAYFPFLRTTIVQPEDIVPDQFAAAAGMPPITAATPVFADLADLAAQDENLRPPSAAMAGIYALTDAISGVWNAPANVAPVSVTAPAIRISDEQQTNLNMPVDGLAVNAIRTFPGRATVVWGARTFDGNSIDRRYVPVRRTLIYVEQSIRTALEAFVFAPNDVQTWAVVVSMVESFLKDLWSSGGLMGSTPTDGYAVQCGLGSTMSEEDVENGVMIVQTMLAMIHPGEFIGLAVEQQMCGNS